MIPRRLLINTTLVTLAMGEVCLVLLTPRSRLHPVPR